MSPKEFEKFSDIPSNVHFWMKNIYSEKWKSEYQVCFDSSGYYLMPTLNTSFEILPIGEFYEAHYGKYVYWLASPQNVGHTLEEIVDVAEYNGVLCYAFEAKDKVHFYLMPALGDSQKELDNAYYCIGSWRKPDFIKIHCPSCEQEFYFNDSQISDNETYETECPYCGMIQKRKK